MSQTTEKAFETYVEEILLTKGGWHSGTNAEWDKKRAVKHRRVIQTALANPLDKFQLGVRKLIEEFMIQRMSENDKIVTRYMDDQEFQNASFPILAKEIFDAVHAAEETKSQA
jgi:type I restriction enzyme R subunit